MAVPQKYCTFRLDGMLFGVEVREVQEIVPPQPLTRVPLSPDAVRGLINLRGQIVTAIDLRRRLMLRERGNGPPPMNVVLRVDDALVSLLVDDVCDVVEVDASTFERPPETLVGAARQMITGAYKLERDLLLVLDSVKAIDIAADAG